MSETAIAPVGVKYIDHVTLIVKDLEASRQFYCDVLGMEQIHRPGFSFGGSWFQAGETQIHLILEHDESPVAGEDMIRLKDSSSRNRHFAFEVEDCHKTVEQLKELGVPLFAGPQKRPDGFVQLYVRDPDGHVVELFSAPSN
jgi:catechol 2,3-dioxygenase-like lactoylglutathione lyase family enzyme